MSFKSSAYTQSLGGNGCCTLFIANPPGSARNERNQTLVTKRLVTCWRVNQPFVLPTISARVLWLRKSAVEAGLVLAWLTLMLGIREASGKGEKLMVSYGRIKLWMHERGLAVFPAFPLGSGSITAFMSGLGIQALLPQEMLL